MILLSLSVMYSGENGVFMSQTFRYFKCNFFSVFSDLPRAFPNICEQIIKETEWFLSKRDLASLDEEKSSLLRQQIISLADDENNICQLISKL